MRLDRFVLVLGAVAILCGIATERSASAQCDSAYASCPIGDGDIYVDPNDPPPTATVPRAKFSTSESGAERGFGIAASTKNAISMSSAACDGFELGGVVAAVSALSEDELDLFEPAVCDGSEPEAALLREFSGNVESPTGQGVVQTIRPDGSGATGDGTTSDPIDLRDQLITEEAGSIFTQGGELTPEIIGRSRVAIAGGDLQNAALISELTKDGSVITDWAKMSTPTMRSLAGEYQMHFYLNLKTGATYYGADYKAVFNAQVVGQ